MHRFQRIILISLSAAIHLAGCATGGIDYRNTPVGYPGVRKDINGDLDSVQMNLVDAAHWAQGRRDVSNNGKRFSMDCSGVVSAIYWKAGIDLQSCYPHYTGNGVARIYRWLEDEQLLYRPDEPAPGDIVFWDNSYDKNGNGVADDDLTHVGMVVSVDDEGQVHYVHHDYISGIIFARMYPPDPSDRSRNSGMRIQSLGPTPDGGITSGDLYRNAGRGWELPPSY